MGNNLATETDKDLYYLRSYSALYHMDLVMKYGLIFGPETAGKVMHRRLFAKGYGMVFLPADDLSRYIVHINHATLALNPELGEGRTI